MSEHPVKPTLAELAAIAEVSVSTVSKVANGASDVSDETRQRVERILKDRGYVATRKRRASLTPVAVIMRDMHSPYGGEVLRGAVEAAAQIQVEISVSHHPRDSGDLRWIDEIAAAGRLGVVAIQTPLNAEERARFARHGLHVVTIDAHERPDEHAYSIGCTNWAGGYEATEHLLGLGHRNIVMLSGTPNAYAAEVRVSGFRAALNQAGVEHGPGSVVPGDFTYESGLEVGAQLLQRAERPTAVFAASDFQALGVIEAARNAGLRVPQDLSVVGFNDLIIARFASPALTTVRQPIAEMGAAAVEAVHSLVSGSGMRTHHLELATRLIVRGSTAQFG